MDLATLVKIANFYGRFTPNYTQIGYYARRVGWGRDKRLDFSGQRWVVTGANAGIGKALMETAAGAGAEVVAVARSRDRLEAAVASLPPTDTTRITQIIADMSLMSETEKLLRKLLADRQKIDVLMNNVGVLLNKHSLTREGYETSFVTNVLSHYQLTEGLLAADHLSPEATIVNMSSGGMYNVPLSIRGLNATEPDHYSGKIAYGFHKRAQVALTNYWNDKYGERGLRVYVTHPGWAKTPGVKFSLPVFWKIQNLILRTPRQGADTAIWLAAERPPVGDEEMIWFDRRPRPTHLFEHTKKPLCTEDELVAYLESELHPESAETEHAAG